jgi:hypothetical protein
VSSRIPSGSRSWRSPPSTLLRVPPMEVERFIHRQLVPTVGPIVMITGEFGGPNCHTCFSKENQVQAYMHARIKFHAYSWHKWITETISRKKKGDYQSITLYPGNGGTKLHKQSTGGSVRLEPATSSQRLHSSFLFLSNIVYSKGEHLSYSASVGKVWMQRLYSGLGYKHLAF